MVFALFDFPEFLLYQVVQPVQCCLNDLLQFCIIFRIPGTCFLQVADARKDVLGDIAVGGTVREPGE